MLQPEHAENVDNVAPGVAVDEHPFVDAFTDAKARGFVVMGGTARHVLAARAEWATGSLPQSFENQWRSRGPLMRPPPSGTTLTIGRCG